MQHFTFDTNDPATFCAITEAGLRAFDRYHRNRDAQTITLPASDWHRVDDDTPQGGAQEAAR